MITDVDMLPMNTTYYTENIAKIDDSKFIYLRDVLLDVNQIAMCYNVALSKTWKQVFDIESLSDIRARLISVNGEIDYRRTSSPGVGNPGWSADQRRLYKRIMAWKTRTNDFVVLEDKRTGYRRLNGRHRTFKVTRASKQKIKSGHFSDYHMMRPHSAHRLTNKLVANLLRCGRDRKI